MLLQRIDRKGEALGEQRVLHDECVQALAEAFCERVSSWLGMRPPTVYWFEEADFREASQAWLRNPSRHDQAADPLREPCEYFRWRGRPAVAFYGYTHRESPLGILINTCRRRADLLDTIAEECSTCIRTCFTARVGEGPPSRQLSKGRRGSSYLQESMILGLPRGSRGSSIAIR